MLINPQQREYAVNRIIDGLASRVRRDNAGNVYVERVDYDELALLAILASRAVDVDGDEIATLYDDYSTGNTVQSILDAYA